MLQNIVVFWIVQSHSLQFIQGHSLHFSYLNIPTNPNLSISPLPTNKIKKNKRTKENRGELTPLCESIFDFNYILLYKIGDK